MLIRLHANSAVHMRYKMSYTHSVPMHNLLCTVLLLASLIAVRPCIARQLLLRQEADRGAACPPQAKAMFDAVMADPQSSTPVLEACNTSKAPARNLQLGQLHLEASWHVAVQQLEECMNG